MFATIRTINALKCSTQLNPVMISPKNYAVKLTIYQLHFLVSLWFVEKKNKLTFVPHSCKAWVADLLWLDIISNFDFSWTWLRGILIDSIFTYSFKPLETIENQWSPFVSIIYCQTFPSTKYSRGTVLNAGHFFSDLIFYCFNSTRKIFDTRLYIL